ncbi:uncharacterized protein SEPMUDRAFT_153745 [Sphaerulina musiva SO2202]|uniref:Uncharacterized protein n=1 Tax=Sphaerulina musiva (strain SO2202) TaxID=692275 RepID=N1QP04_SPHMS|nr:uncharacterized protein SEPMUDRAFT_153745 [Sphaerulina musiva SO2202]EMF17924.1 hypothetical protein SEPMUDRAFT_153745 [Sphaerulina musiva SO2202]
MDKELERPEEESDTEMQIRPVWRMWPTKTIKYTAIPGGQSQYAVRYRRHVNGNVVVTVVVLLLLTSALSIWGTILWHWQRYEELYKHRRLQEDMNGFVPMVSEKSVFFMNDERWEFLEHPTDQQSEALIEQWASLIPNGRGFVELHNNNTAAMNLPPPLVLHNRSIHGIAVFHQLHCLKELGQAITELTHGRPLSQDLKHTYHCIEYLRQVVQCTSDTTLEGFDVTHPNKFATTGWGSTHVCKDFDAVFTWTEQNAPEYARVTAHG